MLTAMVHGTMPTARNAWLPWLNYITKDGERTGIRDAALVTKRGSVSSHTPHFKLSAKEIESLDNLFHNKQVNKVKLLGRTYIINSLDDKHLTAFSGKRFLIVCPSQTMYVVVQSDRLRERLTETVTWIEHLCAKLSSRNY